ncbi:hypothetical protein PBY51_008228 [Eleginops maclovinus]|uniref:Tumor necrosis factor receptor superfamily member 13C n=1 Tax=Eleginops maclovinus TaxID=56733 RepID=A0AAN7XBN3_ELEMC|nr:hypothetical protein PBY51_008228 [Eleginops maclovinus]
MGKNDCPAGSKWDSLISMCVHCMTKPTTEPSLAVVVQLRAKVPSAQAPTARAPSVMLLSPALWIVVVLATVGSLLAVILWFIIYRRQTRHSSDSEVAEPEQRLQKTDPTAEIHPPPSEMFQRAAWVPSPCHHQHLGAQIASEEGFTARRDPTEHAWTEGPTLWEHRIPLPATELGGTALVTTKTV